MSNSEINGSDIAAGSPCLSSAMILGVVSDQSRWLTLHFFAV